ncbi:MAG: tetratricopeptide repeat protein, partial [Candidatus Omnitrophica bacterium]|nr:tetratricopeptide repeat protein [Candidatus Omnitrophota bacterium]
MFNKKAGSFELKSLDLGILYLNQGKHRLAIKEFSRVLKINPQNEIALIKLGHVYLQQKKFLEAITQFKKALESNPDTLEPRE